MRRILLTLIFLFFIIQQSSALVINDTEWTQQEEITLEWGDNYSTGNYNIQAQSFDKKAGRIILVIYKNNKEIHSAIMSAGDTTKVSTIKVAVKTIRGCGGETGTPFSTMTIYTMKLPKISLGATHKMTKQGLANISITLENTGGIRFHNITLNTTLPNDLIPCKDDSGINQTSFEKMDIRPNDTEFTSIIKNFFVGSKEINWINVEIPALPQNITIPIHISAHGYDLDEKPYSTSATVNIKIEPAIKVTKIPLHRIVNKGEDHFNMNDMVYVWISVFNSATTDAFNVSVDETIITKNFILDPDVDLDWTFDLLSRESKTFNYFLRPIRPGEIRISRTTVSREYKSHLYVKTMDATTAKIYGPYLEISKTLNKSQISPGKVVKVSVAAKNTGNHACFLELGDTVPYFAVLIDGQLNNSRVVKPGSSLSIFYTLKIEDRGEFRFPAAVGEYTDLAHYTGIAYSTRPVIKISKPEETPEEVETEKEIIVETVENTTLIGDNNSNETDSNGIPGFSLLTGLISLMFFRFFLTSRS